VFLSHNSANKEYASRLAVALQLLGANVWFDAWKIRPGDSIPGAINQGLADFDIFVLLWSAQAAASKWVDSETGAALSRVMTKGDCRIIPVRLDDYDLPSLVSHRRYIDARGGQAPVAVASEIVGISSEKDVLLAVQAVISDAGLNVREFWGAGVFVCCPSCGARAEHLEGFQADDEEHDRRYAGARCTRCNWDSVSEL
jgi:hypothetical protein